MALWGPEGHKKRARTQVLACCLFAIVCSGYCSIFKARNPGVLLLANQSVNQTRAFGAAPSGHQVVAFHGRVAAGLAAGYVVEVRGVRRAYAKRVEIRVDEAEGFESVGDQLLVDQSHVARPHGSGEAGSTILIGGAGALVGADVEREIGVGGNIRAVAKAG